MTLDDLRKIAEAATPGPWEWEKPSEEPFPQGDESLITTWKEDDGYPEEVITSWGYDAWGTLANSQDRDFIATFNPTKVLELLTDLEEAQRKARTFERQIMRIADQTARRIEQAEASQELALDKEQVMTAKVAAVEKLAAQWAASGQPPLLNGAAEVLTDTIKAVRGD